MKTEVIGSPQPRTGGKGGVFHMQKGWGGVFHMVGVRLNGETTCCTSRRREVLSKCFVFVSRDLNFPSGGPAVMAPFVVHHSYLFLGFKPYVKTLRNLADRFPSTHILISHNGEIYTFTK